MNIKILGSGCPSCQKLEANTKQAVENMQIAATITKVTDYNQMMSYGIMSTPALVINQTVVSAGRILSVADIERVIRQFQ